MQFSFRISLNCMNLSEYVSPLGTILETTTLFLSCFKDSAFLILHSVMTSGVSSRLKSFKPICIKKRLGSKSLLEKFIQSSSSYFFFLTSKGSYLTNILPIEKVPINVKRYPSKSFDILPPIRNAVFYFFYYCILFYCYCQSSE